MYHDNHVVHTNFVSVTDKWRLLFIFGKTSGQRTRSYVETFGGLTQERKNEGTGEREDVREQESQRESATSEKDERQSEMGWETPRQKEWDRLGSESRREKGRGQRRTRGSQRRGGRHQGRRSGTG